MNNQVLLYQVQAFTNDGAGGSPTGVVLKSEQLSEPEMQRIARRSYTSHTAFVTNADGQDCDISIRFFTPHGEIKNCGHATLAAHFVLAMEKAVSHDYTAKQRTQSGIQQVQIYREAGITNIVFEQNDVIFRDVDNEVVQELLDLFDLSRSDLLDQYPIMLASPGASRFLVPLKSHETLANLKPRIPAMLSLCERMDSIGCFALTLDGTANRWEAWGRMFAPVIGVNEDIINGNSSGCLAAYLVRSSGMDFENVVLSLTVFQGHSFGPPGKVIVKAQKTNGKIKTFVGGTAIITGKIEMKISS